MLQLWRDTHRGTEDANTPGGTESVAIAAIVRGVSHQSENESSQARDLAVTMMAKHGNVARSCQGTVWDKASRYADIGF